MLVHKRALVKVGDGSIQSINDGIWNKETNKIPAHAKVTGIDKDVARDEVVVDGGGWIKDVYRDDIYLVFEWDDEE